MSLLKHAIDPYTIAKTEIAHQFGSDKDIVRIGNKTFFALAQEAEAFRRNFDDALAGVRWPGLDRFAGLARFAFGTIAVALAVASASVAPAAIAAATASSTAAGGVALTATAGLASFAVAVVAALFAAVSFASAAAPGFAGPGGVAPRRGGIFSRVHHRRPCCRAMKTKNRRRVFARRRGRVRCPRVGGSR